MATKGSKAELDAALAAVDVKTNGHSAPKILSADEILAADDLTLELVEVPEWGGSVYVQALSGEARGALEKKCSIINEQGEATIDTEMFMVSTVMLCMVNEKRERLFIGDEARAKLNKKSQAGLRRVFDAASRISVLMSKDRETVRGNSAASTGSGV